MFIKPASEDEGERDEQDGFISSERPQHRPACNGCRRPATALCQFSCLGRTRTDERPASRDGTRQRRSGTLIGDATARRPRRRVWRGTLFQRAMNPLAIRPGQGRSAFRPVDPSGPVFSSQCVRTGEPNPDGCGRKACTFFLDIPVPNHSEGMVELVGIEPTTPCLQSRCSPS